MKLPLITRKDPKPGSQIPGPIIHILAFEGSFAIGVNETTLRLERVRLGELAALSEEAYKARKASDEKKESDTKTA